MNQKILIYLANLRYFVGVACQITLTAKTTKELNAIIDAINLALGLETYSSGVSPFASWVDFCSLLESENYEQWRIDVVFNIFQAATTYDESGMIKAIDILRQKIAEWERNETQ